MFTKNKILIFFTLLNLSLYSQVSSGKVFYEASSLWKQSTEINNKNIKNAEIINKMYKKLMNNRNKLTYILKFKNQKSKFKKQEELLDIKKNIILNASIREGNFYHDKKNNISIREKDSYGEILLIYYPKTEWKITNETKKINGYLCGKAITTITENSLLKQTSTIIAWFAFDLPYNYGPNQFSGLPGLVLELKYVGRYKMRAIKIEFNPKEKIEIDMPKKGIKISLKKYEEMIARSFKQNQRNYKRRN